MLALSGVIGAVVALLCNWKKRWNNSVVAVSLLRVLNIICHHNTKTDCIAVSFEEWGRLQSLWRNHPLVRDAAQSLWPLGTTFREVFGHWP